MKPLKLPLPGPKAKAIVERDHSFISPSYPRGYPFVMDHGKGTEIWDVDGNRFLDMAAGIAVVSTGHSNPKVVKAIQDQAEKFIHISSDFYHENWVKLGEKIDEISPFSEPTVSFMCNSGAESVESAIKLAKNYTGRSQFIGFLGGFHGRTMGALSFTASKSVYREGFFPLMSGVTHVPYPNPYRPILHSKPGVSYGQTVLDYIEDEVFHRIAPANDVAGIIIEPIQGEGGYIVPPDDFFPGLRRLCDKYGILLIADEVQSGVGRTGKWWAIEHFGIEPDIITIAKGIASGVPLGIMAAKKSIVEWQRGTHGNTYGGNPIACAAALATLELIGDEYMENAAKVGQYTINWLKETQQGHPCIGEVRGKGFMIGIDYVKDPETHEPDGALRDRIVDLAFEHGLITLGCGESTIRLAPPLSTTQAEMEESLTILDYVTDLALNNGHS